jgi:hypothetical protein
MKAKGVLAMAQSSKAGSTGPADNHDKAGTEACYVASDRVGAT